MNEIRDLFQNDGRGHDGIDGPVSGPDLPDVRNRAQRYRRRQTVGRSAVVVVLAGGVLITGNSIWARSATSPDVVVASPGRSASPGESASPVESAPPGESASKGESVSLNGRVPTSPNPDPSIAEKVKMMLTPLRESKAPPCASPGTFVESLSMAAEKIKELGHTSRYVETFTGVVLCGSSNRVAVFRVGEDAAFKRKVEQIAAAEGTKLAFVDAEISYAEMMRLTKEIRNREPELKANNAPIDSISRHPEGYVIVGIQGDLDAARRILSDLLDHVEIKFAGRSGPG